MRGTSCIGSEFILKIVELPILISLISSIIHIMYDKFIIRLNGSNDLVIKVELTHIIYSGNGLIKLVNCSR